ncbi:hypothetical protein DRJ48_04550 [Candidatus Woesearchaeota archaeon]|nr:MAG: hypothetical protein DRJ48_04550 [Candidatus Woesearchaeota archaeon]
MKPKKLPTIPDPPSGLAKLKLGGFLRKPHPASKQEFEKPLSEIEARIKGELEERFRGFEATLAKLQEEFEGLKRVHVKSREGADSNKVRAELKPHFQNLKQELMVNLEKIVENRTKKLWNRIEKITLRLNELKPTKSEGSVGFEKRLGNVTLAVNELKVKLSAIRTELRKELTELKEVEIPKIVAQLETQIAHNHNKMENMLNQLESKLLSEIKRNATETEQKLSILKKKLQIVESSGASERAYLEESLKELERRFSEELSKIIEWINYFNAKVED